MRIERHKETYPFTAIVGQEAMKMALILNLVDPSIGGVLIRGQKGTGKSTAIRALPKILPTIESVKGCPYHCRPDDPDNMDSACLKRWHKNRQLPVEKITVPLVELPLNATEDRLAGSLDIAKTLASGKIQFQPGLLAAANRGILYIDEVNLLDDHLVDLLLDTAASGVNIVEREGISYSHPSRFILIGTMNPEEGELRPQLLDRFALCVEISGIDDETERREIVRRRMAFDNDPRSFAAGFAEQEALLQKQIIFAQAYQSQVEIPETIYHYSAKLALALQVQGHRTDITLVKAARALAAFLEKSTVSMTEFNHVAPLVLLHRIKKSPMDTYQRLRQKIDQALESISRGEYTPDRSQEVEGEEDELDAERIQIPGSAAAGSILFDFLKKKGPICP